MALYSIITTTLCNLPDRVRHAGNGQTKGLRLSRYPDDNYTFYV